MSALRGASQYWRRILPTLALLLAMALVGGQAVAGMSAEKGFTATAFYEQGSFGMTPNVSYETPSSICPTVWSIVPSVNPSETANYLEGVEVISANDAWAVGSYHPGGDGSWTLTMHWDGNHWTHVSSPNPSPNPNFDLNVLLDVEPVSSNDVWAVGYTYNSAGRFTLIEHWNGSQWSIVTSRNITNSVSNYLFGVSIISSTDVWTVGYYVANVGGYGYNRTLAEHWNGSQWSIIPSPNMGMYNNNFWEVSAVSSSDVWAVGNYNTSDGSLYTLTEHWNGTQWSIVPSLDPVGSNNNFLYGVSGTSSNDVWTVGSYQGQAGTSGTLVEHWDGSHWSVIPSPNVGPGFNEFRAVSSVSSTDVWAVGYHCCGTNGLTTLTEHWNGNQWTIVPSPNAGPNNNYLFSVAALSSEDVWAAGNWDTPGGIWQTLIEHYSPSSPCVTPSPSLTPSPIYAPTPTVTPTAPSILVAHVNWDARPPQPHQLQQLPITLTLRAGTTQIDYPAQPTDQYGFFTVTIGNLPNGTYTWRADDTSSQSHAPSYLAKCGSINLNGAPITNQDMGTMRSGDANNDNRVNVADFNLLKISFGLACGNPQYDNRPDFTGDCTVNISDLTPIVRNFGQESAPPLGWCPE